ncbi:MAG: alpha/beta fold hydrolase [Micavibrio sp.]|nr:alpha/beta fold hydrolase [Micavibrio sp.]
MTNKARKYLTRTFAAVALAGLTFGGLGGYSIWRDMQPAANVATCAAPQGDGHPVLVVPGFTTDDDYMQPLHARLTAAGYKVYGWNAGTDWGPDAAKAATLEAQLQKAFDDNGKRRVSLVGYSHGGIYARELARKHPQLVREVITLAAPINMDSKNISAVHDIYNGPNGSVRDALPVPATALYSKRDWIVSAADGQTMAGKTAENIEVKPGHFALPFSPEGYGIILDRLAQPEGKWKPLTPNACRNPAP